MALLTPFRARVLSVAIVVVGLGAAVTATTVGADPDRVLGEDARVEVIAADRARPAPELVGIAGYAGGEPVTLAGLRGKVVLLDFWTYTCINCLRTFPELRALQDAYGPSGFAVVGVHSPEFEFEKSSANVTRAVRDLGVTWPVAEDPGMATWDAYGIQYWPTQVLLDREGRIRFGKIGEGGADKAESVIRTLLAEGGTVPDARAALAADDPTEARTITPETYFGQRAPDQFAGGAPVPLDGRPYARADPEQARDVLRLTGSFTADNESLSPLAGAQVEQKVRTRDLYVTAQGSGVTVDVTLDGQPVPAGQRGADLRLEGDRTVLDLDESRLFHLLTGPQARLGTLTLSFRTPGARLFTLTYGG